MIEEVRTDTEIIQEQLDQLHRVYRSVTTAVSHFGDLCRWSFFIAFCAVMATGIVGVLSVHTSAPAELIKAVLYAMSCLTMAFCLFGSIMYSISWVLERKVDRVTKNLAARRTELELKLAAAETHNSVGPI